MATNIGRSLDEINQKAKELNGNIKSLTNENKLLDKSLKFDTNPLETLNKRAENTQKSITALTQRIELLKTKQKEYDQQLASGEITQTTYDRLSTDIAKSELQLKQLNAELKQTNTTIALLPAEKFKTLGSNIENVGNKLKVVSAVAVGALAGLTALGLSAVKSADDLQTISTNLGITAEELQYLNYIAVQTDVNVEKMQKSFVKVRDALGTQLSGEANSATKALDQLGISADNFESDLDGFYAVADALGKIKDSTIQATLANDIFGEKIGTEMISFLTAGSDALKGYEDELTNIGVLSNDAVLELAEFDNTMNKIKQSFGQAKNELGLALLPIMEQFANFLETKLIPFVNGIVERFSNLSTETKNLIIGVLGFTAILSPLLIIVGKMTSGIGSIIGLLPKLSGLLSGLTAPPIIAIIGLIAVLLTTLYAKNEDFRNSINNLLKSIQPLFSLLGNLLSGIFRPMMQYLEQIFYIFGEIASFFINVFAGAVSLISIQLIPLMFILETIVKLVQSVITGFKDLISFNWGGFGENQKKIWSSWSSVDFAKDSIANFTDLFTRKTSSNTTEMPDTSDYDYLKNYYNSTSTSSIDNRVVIESINIEKNDYTTADDLVDAVSKKLAIKLQARG